jgi:peptidoglycan/xylan/chitin deacetylase (PgdA/CDA1 family)
MKLVAVTLLLSLALSSSHALYPVGSRVVIIRIDDIQDYDPASSSARAQEMLLQYHIDHKIPALLAIIGSNFGTQPQLIDQIQKGVQEGIFTIAIHGWSHVPYPTMSSSAQITDMKYAKNRLEAIFGIEISAFVPPYLNFTDATIDAMKQNHVVLISSSIYVGDVPREENGIVYIPETVETANVDLKTDSWVPVSLESMVSQIQKSWSSYGLAVALLHPRQFTGEDEAGRWNIYVRMTEWIQSNDGTIIRAESTEQKIGYALDPSLLIVAVLAGMVSTFLVILKVGARRKSGRRSEEHEGSSYGFLRSGMRFRHDPLRDDKEN